jgi:hypothetical protein
MHDRSLAYGKALMGFSPQMRAFQAMANTWLNPGVPEHTGTARRLAGRANRM